VNQSWQVARNEGGCICNGLLGFQGAECNELGPQGQAILAIYLISAIAGMIFGLWGLSLIAMYTKALLSRKESRKVNPSYLALCFASVGLLLLSAGCIVGMVTNTGFPSSHILIANPSGGYSRRISPSLDSATFLLLGLGYIFSICSMTLLPLTWVRSIDDTDERH
jgi:hypothetical protein